MTLFDSKEIKIHPARFVRNLFLILLGAELLIVLGDIFLYQLEWLPWRALRTPFNITREDTLVNWFSSMQTMLTALVLLAIFLLSRNRKKKEAWGWGVLAAIFAFISLDDGARIHEQAGSAFIKMIDGSSWLGTLASGFPSYYWQLVYGPLMLAVFIFMLVFLWRHIGRREYFFWIVTAICLLALAVVLDFVEGTDVGVFDIRWFTHNAKLLEEFVEMFANTVILATFLQVLMEKFPTIALRFRK